MNDVVAKVLRSPLLHFVLIGAALYAIYAVRSGDAPATESADTLRISSGEIAWLEDSWTKRWNRPPTPEERKGLVEAFIRESVLFREALAMGLDQDDVIIRRRMVQKLEFLFQDLADEVEPTEEDLRQFFADNAESYEDPEVLTFTHLFFDPDRRGESTLADAESLRKRLNARPDPAEGVDGLGDAFMLQSYYPQRPETEVSKLFGREFARSVFALSPNTWHGPVLSGYGTHLVFVHEKIKSPPPRFEAVQERVALDWKARKREEFNDEYYARLLERYEVIVEDEAAEGVAK